MVRALFEEFPALALAGFIVWVPMLPGDDAGAARPDQDAIQDRRLRFWFDEARSAAQTWSSYVGYRGPLWDVYAVYDGSAVWSRPAPPPPRIWMHQLDETPATLAADRLDVDRLAREWLDLVGGDSSDAPRLGRRLDERGRELSPPAGPAS